MPKQVKKREAVEIGSPFGWDWYEKCHGKVIVIDHFDASSLRIQILEKFGFTVENEVETFLEIDWYNEIVT